MPCDQSRPLQTKPTEDRSTDDLVGAVEMHDVRLHRREDLVQLAEGTSGAHGVIAEWQMGAVRLARGWTDVHPPDLVAAVLELFTQTVHVRLDPACVDDQAQ